MLCKRSSVVAAVLVLVLMSCNWPKQHPLTQSQSGPKKTDSPTKELSNPLDRNLIDLVSDISADEQEQSKKIAKLLDDGANVNAQNSDRRSALLLAVGLGRSILVETLLERKADPNTQDRWGFTPLEVAVSRCYLDMIHPLLKADAKTDIVDSNGETPLMAAALGGNGCPVSKIVADLVKTGKANPNYKNPQGVTALMRATFHANLEMMLALISMGANIDDIDKSQKSVIAYAILGRLEEGTFFTSLDYLISEGASFEQGKDQNILQWCGELYKKNLEASSLNKLKEAMLILSRRYERKALQYCAAVKASEIADNYFTYKKENRASLARQAEETLWGLGCGVLIQ